MIIVQVRGLPAPQGSKINYGRGRTVESSKKVGPWREAVRAETQRVMDGQPPMDGPVRLSVAFYLPRPKSHTGARGLKPSAPSWPSGRPDLDKACRAALDGMTEGGAWADDAQVVELHAVKVYADDGPPGMVAEFEALP